MTIRITTAAVIFMGSMVLMRADQLVESVQQALKDEGFYYGEVNGDINANLTAAIRRYQIRNGLRVTGELNDETLHSLGVKSAGSSLPTTKAASPTPAPSVARSEPPSDETETTSPAPPGQPLNNRPQGQQVFPSTPVDPGSSPGTLFADTPFATAPPGMQRNVIVSAQIALARYGLYREQIDGIYGPAMELSLRAYQAQTRLPVTGRLDLETLAALRLLPGPRHRYYNPYRPRMRPPPGPPIRGQWEPD
ncbi:MAG TPA: peptidoglycan-binding protein [Candidatus Udaeobacter sp.]|jgi:peptidoglycan hydrolase-like protein with peptidoglycan-binding domain|nr:peptidoglycan-binding protein [Candidatus Udaeobacter sp.]